MCDIKEQTYKQKTFLSPSVGLNLKMLLCLLAGTLVKQCEGLQVKLVKCSLEVLAESNNVHHQCWCHTVRSKMQECQICLVYVLFPFFICQPMWALLKLLYIAQALRKKKDQTSCHWTVKKKTNVQQVICLGLVCFQSWSQRLTQTFSSNSVTLEIAFLLRAAEPLPERLNHSN